VIVARDADCILLDTSVIVNFVEAGMLIPLAGYLPNAAVTLDVDIELRRLAGTRFAELATLDRLHWPSGEPLALPPDLLDDAEALRKLNASPGAHEAANRGEIATALLAARLRVAAIIDDALGKGLCKMRGVPRLSTAQLVAEMVVVGAVDTDSGFLVFDTSTPDGIGRAEFEEALDRARSTLSG
jgi:hypothetical protein